MPVKTRFALAALAVLAAAGCSASPAPAAAPVQQALTATLTTPTNIDLRWPAGDLTAAGHLLEYANAADGPWTALQYFPRAQTTYRHPDLIPETPFFYRVRDFYGPVSAVVRSGDAAPSASAAPSAPPAAAVPVRTPGDAAAPGAVRVVAAEDASVHFTWADRSSDEAGFLVEIRKPGAEDFVPVEITEPDTTTCALSLLPDEAGSAFRVRALYYGPLSPVVTRTTGKD
ncbi:fibronectin type III domain-containing protein [Amycolatopsis rhabdoformis]|uniref:Fibronectin type III domain-containing protein n=1 Tax=Amycolatopsis rhabdoformis TaxID=1448059 RepID=A0ABZ1II76_9PSEU|nr:fibronectin type III domain-containing protein [Amycolatopsis rhabdoformis]WSE33952.1 fibronectin type III domain-containing protein [Amycolatopsis rhabdoformis]